MFEMPSREHGRRVWNPTSHRVVHWSVCLRMQRCCYGHQETQKYKRTHWGMLTMFPVTAAQGLKRLCRSHSWYGRCVPLAGTEPYFHDRTIRTLVTILTELPDM